MQEYPDLPYEVTEQVEIDIKYDGYIKRQLKQVEQFKKLEEKRTSGLILIMIRSIVLELKQYRNLNYVNQYQLDRLPAFPAYLLQISLYLLV